MANIFQKIFLSKNKIIEIDQRQEILQLIKSNPISHHAYMARNGGIVRRFSIKTPECHMYVERTYEHWRPTDHEVQYSLRIDTPKQVAYATHSEVDKFTQEVYMKMYKIWEKKKQHVK